MKKRPVQRPIDARTNSQLCALQRDNVDWGDYWTVIDECSISFVQQKVGEAPTQSITLPRHVFDRFVRWYTTGDHDMRKGR